MALSDYIPPALHRAVTKARASRQPVFADYQTARAARGADYHDPDLAGMVMAKTVRMLQTDPRLGLGEHQAVATLLATSLGLAVSARPQQPLRVLDFGGAFGTSYHFTMAALYSDYKWAVVETPTFVAEGRDLSTPNFRMFSTISDALGWLDGVDLLYSSSAIQYVPDPIKTVRELLATNPTCCAWLRTAFSESESLVVLQTSRLKDNGPGPLPPGYTDGEVHYPRTYVSLPEFLACFHGTHRLLIDYGDGSPSSVVGGQTVITGRNYFFVKSDPCSASAHSLARAG